MKLSKVEQFALCAICILLVSPAMIFYGIYISNVSLIIYGVIVQVIAYAFTPIRTVKAPSQITPPLLSNEEFSKLMVETIEREIAKPLPKPKNKVGSITPVLATEILPNKEVYCPYCAHTVPHPIGSGKAGLKVCKHCNLPFIFYQIPTNPKSPNKEV